MAERLSRDLSDLFDRRLLFVTGKGGVGKSTLSAAAALDSARSGRRTLWVEMSEVPRGGYLFPGYEPAYTPRRIEPNLWGMNLTFQEALEEYLAMVFRIPMLSRMVARNSLFRAFTAALPGLDALVTTGKIWYEEDRAEGGHLAWDRIVVDAPATGHGLALLKFPHAALDIVRTGPVAQASRDVDELLGDRERTALIVVTQLEGLPVDEATELVEGIRADTGYVVEAVVANAVYPDVGAEDRAAYERWIEGGEHEGIAAAVGEAEEGYRRHLRWMEGWRSLQQGLVPRLEALDTDLYQVPWLPATSESQRLERVHEILTEEAST